MTNPSTNMQSMQSVMRRLKKIMALSESSNAGEAAAALHQAQVLMEKYGLSQQDVALSEVVEESITLQTARVPNNDKYLAHIIVDAIGVEVISYRFIKRTGFPSPPVSLKFIGLSYKVEIAKYVFSQLRRQLTKSMNESFAKFLDDHKIPQGATRINAKRRDAYGLAWSQAVMEQVRKLAPVERNETAKVFIEKNYGELKNDAKQNKTTSSSKEDNISAWMSHMGWRDGQKVKLHAGINNEAENVAQIGHK